jgi:glycerol-1-phosphate dehydrogenase [NAD(P)+]
MAVTSITEGLILSGVAMSFAGVSRPASGLEHYFSHMFDMFTLERGTPGSRHGIQVGIGTVLTLRLYDMLKTVKPDARRALEAVDAFDAAVWEENIRRIFGKTGDAVIGLERKFGKNGKEKHRARLSRILDNWNLIAALAAEQLPAADNMQSLLQSVQEPVLPCEIGIPDDAVLDAFIGSREIRDKYILTSLLWDIGLLDEMAERLMRTLK